jgi:hypothetical protein
MFARFTRKMHGYDNMWDWAHKGRMRLKIRGWLTKNVSLHIWLKIRELGESVAFAPSNECFGMQSTDAAQNTWLAHKKRELAYLAQNT